MGDRKLSILLLTNRDSDNLGDQVIEACDIELLHAVMKNLGIPKDEYKIVSKQAAIVSKKYVAERREELLVNAKKYIRESDVVVFGGAPMFNYHYQIFYERTAKIVEIAQQYNKPVIFSAIGIERYDEKSPKCQRLKKAVNLECVRQITTRDGIDELKRYRERKDMIFAKVADPAVFTQNIFQPYLSEKSEKQKVGIFVLRANGFTDNGVPFDRDQAADLWINLGKELKKHGVEYEFITSGHFGDESFLDYLIRRKNVPEKKCVFNMNLPEQLIHKISSYDAILSTRLHPSIISYSLGVPSVGLVWNEKVRRFYENIGYEDRVMNVLDATPEILADKLLMVSQQGVQKDPEYMITVYQYLFSALRDCIDEMGIFASGLGQIQPYGYQELCDNLETYQKPSDKAVQEKLRRKFRRVYDTCNARLDRLSSSRYEMRYHSGRKGENIQPVPGYADNEERRMVRLSSQALEVTLSAYGNAKHPGTVPDTYYEFAGHKFKGWVIRFRCKGQWYWILEDGSFCNKNRYMPGISKKKKLYKPGDTLPKFNLPDISSVVAEARWRRTIGNRIFSKGREEIN